MKKIDISAVRQAVANGMFDQAIIGLIVIAAISVINLFIKDEEDN